MSGWTRWMLCFGLMGCGPAEDPVETILALDGDAEAGAVVYGSTCAACHGSDGEGGSAPALGPSVAVHTEEMLVEIVVYGVETMPAQDLPDQAVADVVTYLLETF